MTYRFVEYGRENLEAAEEYQAQLRKLRDEIAARYAGQLQSAGFFERLWIRYCIHREYCSASRQVAPSDRALFGCHG